VKCPQCGCVFCDDLAGERPVRKRFCSRRCKSNASTDRLYPGRRPCERKVMQFASEAGALEQMAAVNAASAANPGWRPLQYAYECEYGGHWHLTSKPGTP
jgi:hypothetical protein